MSAVDINSLTKILQARLKLEHFVKLNIIGGSMKPILRDGDCVTVMSKKSYEIGDILVFTEGESLVSHRLLDIKDNTYMCKGDNSFYIELIEQKQILGKIVDAERDGAAITLPHFRKALIRLSKAIHYEFLKHRQDMKKTRRTPVYRLFKRIVENKTEAIYKRNANFMRAEQQINLFSFDGKECTPKAVCEFIYSLLIEPMNLPAIVKPVCDKFNTELEVTQDSIEEILVSMVEQDIVDLYELVV